MIENFHYAWLIEPFLQLINQKPFLIQIFAPYASRARNRGPKVNANRSLGDFCSVTSENI